MVARFTQVHPLGPNPCITTPVSSLKSWAENVGEKCAAMHNCPDGAIAAAEKKSTCPAPMQRPRKSEQQDFFYRIDFPKGNFGLILNGQKE